MDSDWRVLILSDSCHSTPRERREPVSCAEDNGSAAIQAVAVVVVDGSSSSIE